MTKRTIAATTTPAISPGPRIDGHGLGDVLRGVERRPRRCRRRRPRSSISVFDLGGDLVGRHVEGDVGDRGAAVLRHRAEARRQLGEGGALLELGRLLVDLRLLAVELGLAVVELLLGGVELRTDGGERAVLARLGALLGQGRAGRRRSAPGLRSSWASPSSSCSRPSATCCGRRVQLVLGGERVGHVGDGVDLRDPVEQCRPGRAAAPW